VALRVWNTARASLDVILSRPREGAVVSKDLAAPSFRRRDSSENTGAGKDTLHLHTGKPFRHTVHRRDQRSRPKDIRTSARVGAGFTSKYKIHYLLHVEEFADAGQAIAREKQLKGWTRKRKLALVESVNPTMKDLSVHWLD